jgi:hypothetical protein
MSSTNRNTAIVNKALLDYSADFEKRREASADTVSTAATKLGMGLSDFQAHKYSVGEVIGPGRGATTAETEEMIKLGRSGLGDFGYMTGAVGSLNQAIGGSNNINQLTTVLGTAVAAGFDKARTSQQFVAAVTDLSGVLKMGKVDTASGSLAEAIKWVTATGRGDEKAVRLAQQGLSDYNQFMTQTEGLMGGMRVYAGMEAGATPGQIAMMRHLGPTQAAEMRTNIDEAIKKKTGASDAFGIAKGNKLLQQMIEAESSLVLKKSGKTFESAAEEQAYITSQSETILSIARKPHSAICLRSNRTRP